MATKGKAPWEPSLPNEAEKNLAVIAQKDPEDPTETPKKAEKQAELVEITTDLRKGKEKQTLVELLNSFECEEGSPAAGEKENLIVAIHELRLAFRNKIDAFSEDQQKALIEKSKWL